jgi:hypothetical protein
MVGLSYKLRPEGGLALLSSICSSKTQRIGDLLANTIVINVNKNHRLKYENLLKLEKMDTHIVQYPEVINLSEESILTIKEAIIRYNKYQNYSHSMAIKILVKKLSLEMNVKPPKLLKDKMQFLQTIIKDYVSMTR